MTVLVDTCGWIEFLTEGRRAEAYATVLGDMSEVLVPTVVQYELFKWVCRERDESLALQVIAHSEKGRVLPLTGSVALLAAELSRTHRLAMADAMIYAHARLEGVAVWTSDAHFENLDEVRYIS